MKIKWLGHSSFLINGDGVDIITDPYKPSITNLEPVDENTDIVVRSSSDDEAHCYLDTIPKGYTLLTATDYIEPDASTQTVKGIEFRFVPSQESLIHKEVARENAFYRFSLEGINIAHLGDVGNPLSDSQLDFLDGIDILIALVGGPPTIELPDLKKVIDHVQPRAIIPMHFRIPGPPFFMLPIEELLSYFPDDEVERTGTSEIEFSKSSLPEGRRVFVLEPSKVKQ